MYINFYIGITIACVCIFIGIIVVILYFVCDESIEEDVVLTARSSESTVVENPAHNV